MIDGNHSERSIETEDGNNTIVNIGGWDVDLATWTWAQWQAFGPKLRDLGLVSERRGKCK